MSCIYRPEKSELFLFGFKCPLLQATENSILPVYLHTTYILVEGHKLLLKSDEPTYQCD